MKARTLVATLLGLVGVVWLITEVLDRDAPNDPLPEPLTVVAVDSSPEGHDLEDARSAAAVPEPLAPDGNEAYEKLLASPQEIEALLFGPASGLERFTEEELRSLCLVVAEHRVFSRREMRRESLIEGLTRLQAIERYPSRLGIELSEMEQETVDKIVETHLPAIEQLAESIFDLTTVCAKRSWDLGEFAFYKEGEEKIEPPVPPHPGPGGWEVGGGVRGGFMYHFRFTTQGHPDLEAEYARLKQRKLAVSQEVFAYLKSL